MYKYQSIHNTNILKQRHHYIYKHIPESELSKNIFEMLHHILLI